TAVERHPARLSTQSAQVLIDRVEISVIVGVHVQAEGNLMEVAVAPDRVRFLFRAGERRQKHARQNGNDCNHYEKFDQGESRLRLKSFGHGMSNCWHKAASLAS